MARKIWRVVKVAVIVYVLFGVLLYFIQDQLLFHPQSLPKNHKFNFVQPFTELNIPVPEGRNLSVVKFTVDSPVRGVVLYFHGNRQNVERYAKHAHQFTSNGYEVWTMDYPGFGKSTGKRSEQTIYNDAVLLYNMALHQTIPDNIIIYGKSMGTGVAAQLASVRECRQLILETPYYSIDALAKHYFPMYPVIPLTKYAFPTHKYLQNVKAPVTIFHGTNDEVIPYKQAKQLKSKHKHVQLITIENGKHNNLNEIDHFSNNLNSLLQN
ncbi:MAG: alpha/beta hydrolase [Chitinophagaceae bacterium]